MEKKDRSSTVCGISMVFIALFITQISAYSAGISGKWKAEFDTRIGPQKYTFTFSQSDTGLCGTAVSDINGEIREVVLSEIKLDSINISFVEMLPFQGMELRISYDGIVSEKEMQLNRHVGDFVTEKIVAKREADSK